MAYILADHIISPLGDTSEENYLAVKAGKSGIHAYVPSTMGMPDSFTASLMEDDSKHWVGDSTHLVSSFEHLAFHSASCALQAAGIEAGTEKIVLILSSTKGDVEGMTPLADSAQRISVRLGIQAEPIVVCNACISGLSALILADRLLELGIYDYAVVCGCDVPQRFIISGFQSLKALSSVPCRPFDMERFGLNLGEAAATIVLGSECSDKTRWQLGRGYVKNDAFHISAPSKTGEGLYLALMQTLNGIDHAELALVNAHGTATLFNDQMESVAIQRAGLSDIPTNALKGYFGHTLGAAGILETILSMKAIDDHTVLGTKGFEELGVSGKVDISAVHRNTDKHVFVKMLSGFGGCNATMLVTKEEKNMEGASSHKSWDGFNHCQLCHFSKRHHVKISPEGVVVDGDALVVEHASDQASLLTAIYKKYVGDYPKYYKMDQLSRLGFVASELLLKAEQAEHTESQEPSYSHSDRAVVLFNHSSSVDADVKYMETITDRDNYFPSPSIFVYTLPNIVTGEIAIRNQYHGETSFYILSQKDESQMDDILQASFVDSQTQSILTGWLNYDDEAHFEADLYIVERS